MQTNLQCTSMTKAIVYQFPN